MASELPIEALRALRSSSATKVQADFEFLRSLGFQLEESTLLKVKGLSLTLQSSLRDVLTWSNAIFSKVDPDQIENELTARDKLVSQISEATILAQEIVRKIEGSVANEKNKSSTTNLPVIRLPYFEGNPIEYPSFIEAFKVVDNNSDLSNAAKLTYLIGQLKGRALNAINSFARTDANYTEALEVLLKRYGNTSVIINTYLDNLINLKPPTRDLVSFEKFAGEVESNSRQLKSLDPTLLHESRYVLGRLIELKLPSTYREHLDRTSHKERWQLSELRDKIQIELALLEKNKNSSVAGKDNYDKIRKFAQRATSAVTVADQRNVTASNQRFKCFLCFEEHSVFQCTSYSSLGERKRRISQLRLCVRCLRGNHQEEDCVRHYPCKRCGVHDHHGIFCPRNYSASGHPLNNNQQFNNQQVNKSGNNSAHRPPFKPQAPRPQNHSVTPRSAFAENAVMPVVENRSSSGSSVAVQSVCSNTSASQRPVSALPTAMLRLCKRRGTYKIRAMFDPGSQRTFILSNTTDNAKLRFLRKEPVSISGFNSTAVQRLYDIAEVKIKTNQDTVEMEAIVVESLPEVNNPPGIQSIAHDLTARGIQLADDYLEDGNIQMLIGADNYYKIVECPTVNNVRLINSKVGALISGPCPTNVVQVNAVTVLQVAANHDPTDVNSLWELEKIGINPDELHPDDELAQKMFEESIEHNGTQYVARLPWKAMHPNLPSNYGLAKGRLLNNINSLQRNPMKFQSYHDIIKDQLSNDFIEVVDEASPPIGEIVHYIPHHAVVKESPTTPIRIVYDCSAKMNKTAASLNSCLFSGPSLIPELTQILMRFRIDKFAITADITKAFLRIGLNVVDRDATRFLWVQDIENTSVIITYRFKSILFGATCSQFILNATIKKHLNDVSEDDRVVADKINRNIYVDNIISTAKTVQEIEEFYVESTNILARAGLPLRSWATNATPVMDKILADQVHDKRQEVPILGMSWNVTTDMLSLKHHPVENNLSTKRLVLQALASQYDPLGICAPVIIKGKLLMQDIWRGGHDWDDILPTKFIDRWGEIAQDFNKLNTIEVPRAELQTGQVTLHAFADASKLAYGAVIYAVQDSKVAFLFAKGKVTPIKYVSIPRLELVAALIAVKLMKYVIEAYKDEYHVHEVHCYSDSQVALGWIKSNQSLPVFVQNRVNDIATLLPEAQWHYVASAENPADILSRGTSVQILKGSDIWWHGPRWLLDTLPGIVPEQREARIVALPTAVTVANDADQICNKIVERCSIWTKAIRVHARLVRMIKLWKMKLKFSSWKEQITKPLRAMEMNASERALIIAVQRINYPEVHNYLNKSIKIKKPEIFNNLALGLDDGLIVCISRLEHADISESAKRPILLPTKHAITTLIIKQAHFQQLHMGVASTLACVREKFWVPRARQRVKAFVLRCVKCIRERGTAYPRPPVPALPAVRVQESRPFANVGVDYCGPYNTGTVTQPLKRWVALFTCTSTRAVHLEVADDLSAIAFIHVLHRFAARRSFPSSIISDNGTNFCATANILEMWQKDEAFQSTLANRRCIWKFNPSRAAWFGGFFERLIKMTKQSLSKTLGNNRVTDTELRTLMCRIEAQLNDRPLTFVSDQLDDPTALTPSMLTHGFRLDSVPQPSVDPEEDDPLVFDREMLTKRQRHNQLIYQRLLKRWNNEYLKMLRLQGQKSSPNIVPEVGDIVLIHEDAPRLTWQLGKIVSTFNGCDGHIRVANVKTKNGVLTRPIAKLYPLEIRHSEPAVVPETGEEVEEKTPDVDKSSSEVTVAPPLRAAARQALSRMQRQFAAGSV